MSNSRPAGPTLVPFVDLASPSRALASELEQAFGRFVRSGQFILGDEVERFEEEMCRRLGVRNALGVSSGSDALLAALMALDIGPGDEVLCPAFTFFATAGSVWRVGAKPVFVDISPTSYTSTRADFEKKISPRTKALIAVHLFGLCAEMEPIAELAQDHRLPVIEDAAQAMGATYRGRAAGSLGDLACFSFYPTKNLGGFGDGGLVTTGDESLAERIRALRNHGQIQRDRHEIVGGNFRLDALQATLLRVKLPLLEQGNDARRRKAAAYSQSFMVKGLASEACADSPTDKEVRFHVPTQHPGHVFHQYAIRVIGEGTRDRLFRFLATQGIQAGIYYPVPLHLQPCFSPLGYTSGDFPVAERLAEEVLALPLFPEMTAGQIRSVVDAVAAFFEPSHQ